jgi:hypothetical protein
MLSHVIDMTSAMSTRAYHISIATIA